MASQQWFSKAPKIFCVKLQRCRILHRFRQRAALLPLGFKEDYYLFFAFFFVLNLSLLILDYFLYFCLN